MKVEPEPASRQGAHYGTAIPNPFRYRQIMKMIPIATLALTAGLFLAPALAQQVTPQAPEHSMPMPQSGGMMNHDKMMADMKAADARLEALAQTMKSASGNDKVRAMQELLTELVHESGRHASSDVDDARPHDVSDAAQMNVGDLVLAAPA